MADSTEVLIERCARVSRLNERYAQRAQGATTLETPSCSVILRALNEFMEVVRYLNTRRSATTLALDAEAQVQDAIYLMLRPWIPDLVPESPTDRIANRYTIKDFISSTAATIIEAKYIRDKDHGKNISREIHDDIETYRHDPRCSNLLFFVYDPDARIPDQAALRRQVETHRVYDGRSLHCHLVLKP